MYSTTCPCVPAGEVESGEVRMEFEDTASKPTLPSKDFTLIPQDEEGEGEGEGEGIVHTSSFSFAPKEGRLVATAHAHT